MNIFPASLLIMIISVGMYGIYKYLIDLKNKYRSERNIKRRMILANYESILDMDEQEKGLMQQTFMNTMLNSRSPIDSNKNKKDKRILKIREFKERTVNFFFQIQEYNEKEGIDEIDLDIEKNQDS